MTVHLEASVSRSLSSSGGAVTVEVALDPVAKAKPTIRHIVLLIDTSASMVGDKLQRAKDGARDALHQLCDDDYVSVIGFDSALNVVLPMVKWGDIDSAEPVSAVGDLAANGGTDIYKGLEESRDQLKLIESLPRRLHAVQRIILLSDGQDRYDASTYRDLASEYNDDGISIMAAGIGSDYDETVMLALANGSGGKPTDLTEDDIEQFLKQTVRDTENVIASNPEVRIEPAQGFVVTDQPVYFDAPTTEQRLIDTSSSQPTLELPEIQVDSTHRFSFKALGQPKSPGLTHDLACLQVVDSTDSVLAETDVQIHYEGEGSIIRPDVEKTRAIAKATVEIQDPDVSKQPVTDMIANVEDRGWDEAATEIRKRLSTAEEDGGLIRISHTDED